MRIAPALRYSLAHTVTSIGVAGTVLLVATRSNLSPWENWVATGGILLRALGRYPHNLYALAVLAAVLSIPVRAGISDARSLGTQPVTGVGRQAFAAALSALCAPILYYGLSTLLNNILAAGFSGHRWNHVEALAIGIWAFATIPVVLITSHMLRRCAEARITRRQDA